VQALALDGSRGMASKAPENRMIRCTRSPVFMIQTMRLGASLFPSATRSRMMQEHFPDGLSQGKACRLHWPVRSRSTCYEYFQ